MTKKDLQKELLEKVKEGVKPSDLKRLKRSKSADDIATRDQVNYREDAKRHFKRVQELEQELKNNPPTPLLAEQLKEKQAEIEELRSSVSALSKERQELKQKLEEKATILITSQPIESELSDLDQTLIARHQSLKDWFIQYGKTQQLETELQENIEQASEELINQDQEISKLRNQRTQFKLKVQQLERDLNLSQRLVQLRKNPPFNPDDSETKLEFLRYLLYGLTTLWFGYWLVKYSKGEN